MKINLKVSDMKESMVIYRSFVEAGKKIKNKTQRLKYYEAIFDFGLDEQETTLDDIAGAVFEVVKPQIVANNIRYSNGLKGGRKKKNQNETKTKPKETEIEPNENVNDNDNVNENVNDNVNENDNAFGSSEKEINIFECFEEEFGRTISQKELQMLSDWLEKYTEEEVIKALRKAIIYNKKDFNYINRILENGAINDD